MENPVVLADGRGAVATTITITGNETEPESLTIKEGKASESTANG